jgi:pimeloyl-ACP methyl ester carboxylesterase
MTEIGLIHGAFVGLKFWQYRDRQTKHGSFRAFIDLIENSTAVLYNWAQINQDLNFWQVHHIPSLISYYEQERAYTNSAVAHDRLDQFLAAHQPKTIACHSLGCHLLLKYLNKYPLPDRVDSIHLAQGDFDRDFAITNPNVLNRIEQGHLKIYNYYYPWDQMLLISIGANRRIAAGIAGTTQDYFIDRFFPQITSPNLHHAQLCSTAFKQAVMQGI